MRRYKKSIGPEADYKRTRAGSESRCIYYCRCPKCTSRCSCPNDIGPENEGDEGYLSPDSDLDAELVGRRRGPRFEKPEDAIPAQSVFIMRARHRLGCVDVVAASNRVKAICTFFTFILQPAYAPFHRVYNEWRAQVHAKCDEFLSETTDETLRTLCERFKAEFPLA